MLCVVLNSLLLCVGRCFVAAPHFVYTVTYRDLELIQQKPLRSIFYSKMGDARPSLLVEEGWVCGFRRLSFIGRWWWCYDLATLINRGGTEGDAARDCLKALSARRRVVWWFDLWKMVVVSCEGDGGGEGGDLGATTKWRGFITGEGDLRFAVVDVWGEDVEEGDGIHDANGRWMEGSERKRWLWGWWRFEDRTVREEEGRGSFGLWVKTEFILVKVVWMWWRVFLFFLFFSSQQKRERRFREWSQVTPFFIFFSSFFFVGSSERGGSPFLNEWIPFPFYSTPIVT